MSPCVSSTGVRNSAFTLVESALALGVVAFVLVALVGVWPSGQESLRGAMDMTIAAHVAQRISAEVEQAHFPDVLTAAGLAAGSDSGMGALPRRYFSDAGREVPADDPARIYEVLTRVVHREQLPSQEAGIATRWNAHGQLVLTIEVVASPNGVAATVGGDGLVDRAKWQRAVLAFPFSVGGNAAW